MNFNKKVIFTFWLCIFISGKVLSNKTHEMPVFNITFESPDEWSFLGQRIFNKAYTATFKVTGNEEAEKKYSRIIYFRTTKTIYGLEDFFRSKKIRIENSRGSKIIYESDISSVNKDAFLLWSYFDNVNKSQYMTAERMIVRDKVLLRIVGSWPLLENCKAQRVYQWLDNMNKLFSSVKINNVILSNDNPLIMDMMFSHNELESKMQSLCQQ